MLLANLFGLLLGFALLSKHFEASQRARVAAALAARTTGRARFVLLVMIFVLSSFLDNIAAALIGGTIAGVVFRGKVHIGYLAAIVAASNAGGVGQRRRRHDDDDDVDRRRLAARGARGLHRGAVWRMVIFGIPAAMQQQRYSPIIKRRAADVRDRRRARVHRRRDPRHGDRRQRRRSTCTSHALPDRFPFIGAAVWVALLLCVPLRTPALEELPGAFKGSMFLLSLVLPASMMPVHKLPDASWQVALGLGFVSAVFDNIPLTALALKQGGYDWGFVAYRGRLRRIDDLVRLVGRRRADQPVSRRQIGVRVAARRLARRARVRHRICRDARCSPHGRPTAHKAPPVPGGAGARKVGAADARLALCVRWPTLATRGGA